MALIKFGGGIADMRGSIGGTVFSRNASGAIARNRTKPTYSGTTKQLERAATIADLSNYWKTVLTTAERTLWDNLAKETVVRNRLGETSQTKGINLFIKSNASLDMVGVARVTAPPAEAITPPLIPTIAHLVDVGISISAIGAFDDSLAGSIMCTASLNLAHSKNFYKGPFPRIYTFEISELAAPPYTVIAN